MFIRQQWTESRLILPSHIFEDGDDYVTFPPQFFDNLWQPDPYFINSKVVGKNQCSLYMLCYVCFVSLYSGIYTSRTKVVCGPTQAGL